MDETYQILLGLRERYEAHHKLRYTDDSLDAAAKYSSQYISDRFLPDKVCPAWRTSWLCGISVCHACRNSGHCTCVQGHSGTRSLCSAGLASNCYGLSRAAELEMEPQPSSNLDC